MFDYIELIYLSFKLKFNEIQEIRWWNNVDFVFYLLVMILGVWMFMLIRWDFSLLH